MVDFRLLGPIEAWSDRCALDVGTTKQQAVLATLLLNADRPVTAETLIDRVWGDAPPASARATLQSHLSRIRRMLDNAADLRHQSGAYRLRVAPGDVDLHRARELLEAARAGDLADERRAEKLREAADLWHGDPLSGLGGQWMAQMRGTLRALRLDILVDWALARLRLGDPDTVIAVVRSPVADNPLAEPLVAVLLRALIDAGRDAEALAVYDTTRRRLADELGADPSADLRGLHQAILLGAAPDTRPPPAPYARPAQLPADPRTFTGRTGPLGRLNETLGAAGSHPAGALVVVSGTAGVGKTALVVRWAHQVAGRFPDGQLYANLRGYAAGPPVSPDEILRDFLEALGVAPDRMPAGHDGLVGLFRSLLADRRMLIVLDNARDADQVRPLLPGSAGSVAIVASRNQLPGLPVTDAAVPVPLVEPTLAEARELVARRIGADRAAAGSVAVDRIIVACGRLPLALSVLATRAALQPDFPLDTLADELREAGSRLDALDLGDGATDVRVALSWSYGALGADAQRLYRLTGLNPGPDLPDTVAAGLALWPMPRTRRALDELTRAHLLTEPVRGRFTCHDLLHEHAVELVERTESASDRADATRRLLDSYLYPAYLAARLLDPHRELLVDAPIEPDGAGVTITDRDAALGWLSGERANLMAALHLCDRQQLDSRAWHLAWCLYPLNDYRGDWTEQLAAQRLALAAAQRWGNLRCEAHNAQSMGAILHRLDRHAEAREQFQHVIDQADRISDPASAANAHLNLIFLCFASEEYRQAIDHALTIMAYYEGTGELRRLTRCLETVGWCRLLLDEPEEAIDPLRRALSIYRDEGDRNGEAAAVDSLGEAYTAAGRYELAFPCFQQSIDLTIELGDRYHEALVRQNLGAAYRGAGQPDRARTVWQHALAILDELNHADAASLRANLRSLDDSSVS